MFLLPFLTMGYPLILEIDFRSSVAVTSKRFFQYIKRAKHSKGARGLRAHDDLLPFCGYAAVGL